MALNGERGVDGRRWGSWGVSVQWSCLLLVVGGFNESNGGRRRVVADRGRGMNDRFCGGDPLRMVDCFDDIDWCRLTLCRVSPGEDVWMGMVAVVRRVDVMVVAVEARWLRDFVYLPVCRVSNTIALGSNAWVGALMVSTESTPGISVF